MDFIVGCARSGTTLLRAMLDSHPDLAIPPESHFIPGLLASDMDPITFLEHNAWLVRWELDVDVLAAALAGAPVDGRRRSPAETVEAIYRCYAAERGKTRWADKTPPYVERMDLLAAAFPASRFIHMVRDGRDVASSLVEAPWRRGESLGEALGHWQRSVGTGRSSGLTLGDTRYHEVRFEQLVAEPEPVLRGLVTFLDLPWSPDVLEHGARAVEARRTARYPDAMAALAEPLDPGRRDWRRDLSTHQQTMALALVGDTLDDFGYPRRP